MKKSLLILLITGCALVSGVFAEPELDTTFNSSGRLFFYSGSGVVATDMAVQPDNKVILSGMCDNGQGTIYPFCFFRINENGTIDESFTGVMQIPGSEGGQVGFGGIKIQPDGKVVMAGYSTPIGGNDVRVTLVRLNLDRSLDTTFGSGGIVTSDIKPNWKDMATQLAIQPDGKIVVTGYFLSLPTFTNYQQFVARYLPDGTLDGSFGKGGVVTTVIPEYYTRASTVAIQPDGKIMVAGSMATVPGSPTSQTSCLLMRLNSDGSPDTTWDGDGIKSIVVGSNSNPGYVGVLSLAIQLDGRVVLLSANNFIFRLNPDGSLDTSFDGDGSRPMGSQHAEGLMGLGSGKIMVTGGSANSSLIAKFNLDGSPDTGFSGDGYFTTGSQESGRVIAIDNQGRTVVAGRRLASGFPPSPSYYQFLVFRLAAPPAQNVAVSGRAILSNGTPVRNITVALQYNGTTIGTARTNPFGYFSFPSVLTGRYYSVSVKSRGLAFSSTRFFVDDEIANFNLVGESLNSLSERIEK